jgi:uncharacterized protein (DUF697 family)
MNLLSIYEKLEKLVQKLPERLQHPILREITPIKAVFLHGRAPRLLLLGDRAASRAALVNGLFGAEVAEPPEDYLQDGAWQLFSRAGKLRVLDARRPAALALVSRALTAEPPDACLFLHTEPSSARDVSADLEHAKKVFGLLRQHHEGAAPAVFGVAVGSATGGDADTAFQHLNDVLGNPREHPFGDRVAGIFVLSASPAEAHRLAKAIAPELPVEARLDLARLSGVREIQRETAQGLVKSVSAICGAIGAQPIPLADFPILTSLQAGMVAGIMHISGREMSIAAAREFMGAVGASVGVGLALREGARAALKLVPVWGDLVAGGVAAAGTYAIGKAATAYFIDGITLTEAKGLFRKSRKSKPLLKEK